MGTPIILEALQKPVTSLLVLLLTAIWMRIHQKGLGYEDVGMSFEKVATHKELWRIVSAQFSHVDFLHLLFNGSALWSLGVVETLGDAAGFGSLYYLQMSLNLLLFSGAAVMSLYFLTIKVFHREQYLRQVSVGYSCVVFGWMTILAVRQPGGHASYSILGLSIPAHLVPFGSLALTQVLIPRASFVGHLAGILVGYAAGFGAFAWMTPWWTLSLTVWAAIGVLWSLARQEGVHIPFLTTLYSTEPDIETASAPALIRSVHSAL